VNHTPGPWKWFGNVETKEVYLATVNNGRRFVMQFGRWGMQGAQPTFQTRAADGSGMMTAAAALATREVPYRGDIARINHPDALLIAAAPELLEALRVVAGAETLAPTIKEIARAAIAKAEGK
jgi:hypothetical protein